MPLEIYPKFKISSVYDLMECEKRFFLISTGRAVKKTTFAMTFGKKAHSVFEKNVMQLPQARKIEDIRQSFLQAKETGNLLVSSEVPAKFTDDLFSLVIVGKIDGIVIDPLKNEVKIIENKPRMSEYAAAQSFLYGYVVKKLLSDFSPRVAVEIRNTSSQEVFSGRSYGAEEEKESSRILGKVSSLLNQKVDFHSMQSCGKIDCVCKKVWW
jgi:hypothetical protein